MSSLAKNPLAVDISWEVQMSVGGEFLPLVILEEDGRIADKLRAEDKLRLVLVLGDSASHLIPFRINKQGSSTPPAAIKESPLPDLPGKRFCLDVTVQNQNGRLAIDHHASTLRVMEINFDGQFVMWQVGILCQGENFYLLGDKVFDCPCHQQEGKIVIPTLSKWETLHAFINEHCADDVALLPEELPQTDGVHLEDVPLSEKEAVVLNFRPFNGWGIVRMADGKEARLHWQQWGGAKNGQLIRPETGQIVRYNGVKASTSAGGSPELTGWSC